MASHIGRELSEESKNILLKFIENNFPEINKDSISRNFHVTNIFSNEEIKDIELKQNILRIKPKKLTIFQNNILVLEVESLELQERFNQLNKSIKHTYESYSPHITLAYNFNNFKTLAGATIPEEEIFLEKEYLKEKNEVKNKNERRI